MSSSYQVSGLVAKMKNVDADFRFMALNDLMNETNKPNFFLDPPTEAQVVDQVLGLFHDTNSEVKNQAVKAIGALVKKVSESRLLLMVSNLITYSASPKDEQLRDLANLGLRTVIREVQPSTQLSHAMCVTTMVPKLVEQLSAPSAPAPDVLLNAAELLQELYARFESDLRSQVDLQAQTMQSLVHHLGNTRPAVKKRVADALSQLIAATPFTSDLLKHLSTHIIQPSLSAGPAGSKYDLATVISLVGSIATRAPEKLGALIIDESDLITKMLALSLPPETQEGSPMEEDADDDKVSQTAELREAVLLTMERLLLKCPKESSPFINATLRQASVLIEWDPNFFGGAEDEDEDEEMEDDDEVDDDFDEQYSDDEDNSWKVRRAATRVFRAAFETRPDMLPYFVRNSVPSLIGRFNEREQSVKLEIWSTYARLLDIVTLLNQPAGSKSSAVPGSLDASTARAVREDTPNTLKRKRDMQDTTMTSATEEASLVSVIAENAQTVCKKIVKQINPKSIAVSQAGFGVLDSLVSVLNGGLETQLPALAPVIEITLPSSASQSGVDSSAGTVTSLKMVVLSFMAKLFISHSFTAFGPLLAQKFVPCLAACTADKFNKIASAGFQAVSALIKSMAAEGEAVSESEKSQVASSLYKATASRLEASATDSEVRESAVITLGDLMAFAGDALDVPEEEPLKLLSEALRREVTRTVAVRTTGKIAASPLMRAQRPLAPWIAESIGDVATFLRQNNRVLKVDTFACLPNLISAAGPSLGPQYIDVLIQNVSAFLSVDDLLLLPSAVNVLSALLVSQPEATLQAATFSQALHHIYALVDSPLLQSGIALDAFLKFFGNLVKAGSDPMQIIERLKKTTSRAGPRCIGAVVSNAPEAATPVADVFIGIASSPKSSDANVAFSFYALGEVGRVPGYNGASKAFEIALNSMTSSSAEEVRSAAAFALGNLAVGATELVDQVIARISSGSSSEAVLALHSLKEFIAHAQPSAISTRADSLWVPLFNICAIDGPPPPEAGLADDAKPEEKKARDRRIEAAFKQQEPIRHKWQQSETSRSVAAECLGKITLTDPARFLPLLQSRASDELAGIRCAVITAIRFTLIDTTQGYDTLLMPVIVSYLSLMKDANLDVRKISLSTFNSAASHKTHLVRDHLPQLLPLLYAQTVINKDFIRIVEMGPFKHRVDDGLEVRKAAYEACYTLLDTCLGRFDALEMLDCVLRGLSDDNEIRAICYLMLIRLSQVSPAATTLRLDAASPAFTAILNEKMKDTAVKQEQERHLQIQRSALRAFAVLSKLSSPSSTPKFDTALEGLQRGSSPWSTELKQLLAEPVRSGGADMDMD